MVDSGGRQTLLKRGINMIIYQIMLAIIVFGSIIGCKTSDGVLCGLSIWFLLCFIPLVVSKKSKKMTKQERIANIKKYKYKEIYYNHFGELP